MPGHQLLPGAEGAAEDADEELQGARGALPVPDRWPARSCEHDTIVRAFSPRHVAGALLVLGAVACAAALLRPIGPPALERGERRKLVSPLSRPLKTSVAADLKSRVEGLGATQLGTDTGCSNWDAITIQTFDVHDEVMCSLRCKSNPNCADWNFWAARPNCSQGAFKNCNLFSEGCVKETSRCWDLYTRPSVRPASDESVPVFPHGVGGVSCYRIPAAVKTPHGRLVAFSEARHGPEGNSCADEFAYEIAMSYSDDLGKSWSTPNFAVGSKEYPVFNPYPTVLKSGKIVLIYGKAPAAGWDGHRGIGIGMKFSTDGGDSWSAELDVTDQFGIAGVAQPGPGAGIAVEMSDGKERIIVVSHMGEYIDDLITISDDDGVTWRTIKTDFPHMDEATLADLGGGEILLAMRHRNMSFMGRGVSRSMDYGETWSPIAYNLGMQSAICEGSLLPQGDALYFSAPLVAGDPDVWRREMILVRKSEDGGRSWYGDTLVQAAASPGYSALVAVRSSTLGVVFETDAGIHFSKVNV
mmetsp:Transcript_81820/g.213481  ORF Transcript_81820/g.213481 Transcript_81820/m.213481 type:complete len:527 (-) Transcript_81820:209-1789(-)